MIEASLTFEQETLPVSTRSISSLELADGVTPCGSSESVTTSRPGPDPAHASHSVPPGKEEALRTSATSGPRCSGSLKSAALQQSLASKLVQRLGSVGSMEYRQTWKEKVTPAGRLLWAHTASGHPISDSVSIGSQPLEGWPKTPQASDGQGGVMEIRPGTTGKYKLRDYAHLAGWATPQASDPVEGARTDPSSPQKCLGRDIRTFMAGWRSPQAQNGEKAGMPPETRVGHNLNLQDQVLGTILEPFFVPTGRRVVLDPEFSLWLMGFPEAWVTAAPGAKDWLEAQARLVTECSKDQGTP